MPYCYKLLGDIITQILMMSSGIVCRDHWFLLIETDYWNTTQQWQRWHTDRGGLAMLAFWQCRWAGRIEVIKRVIFGWKTGEFLDFAKVGPVECKLGWGPSIKYVTLEGSRGSEKVWQFVTGGRQVKHMWRHAYTNFCHTYETWNLKWCLTFCCNRCIVT